MKRNFISSALIICFTLFIPSQYTGAAQANIKKPQSSLPVIEKEKSYISGLADKYMRSITNVCDGKLIYFRLKYYPIDQTDPDYQTNIKYLNNKYFIAQFGGNKFTVNHDLMNFNVINYIKSVKYYPAKIPSEAERLNGIKYRDIISVIYGFGNPNANGFDFHTRQMVPISASKPPTFFQLHKMTLRYKPDGKEWSNWWTDYDILGFTPLERLVFGRKEDGKFSLIRIFNRNNIHALKHPETSQIDQDIIPSIEKYLISDDFSRPECNDLNVFGSNKISHVNWVRNNGLNGDFSQNQNRHEGSYEDTNREMIRNQTIAKSEFENVVSATEFIGMSAIERLKNKKYSDWEDIFGASFGDTSTKMKSGVWWSGVTVYRMKPDSIAAKMGLRPQDQIIMIDDVKVKVVEDINDFFSKTDLQKMDFRLQVIRNRQIINLP